MRDYPGWVVKVTQDADAPPYGFKLYSPTKGGTGLADYIRAPKDKPHLWLPSDVADAVKGALGTLTNRP